MGIPHLTAQIRPYAEPISWTLRHPAQQGEVQAHTHVVIDGPSFAYYICRHCSISKLCTGSVSHGIPTYEDLAREAISWLDDLESFGLHVKHIFFDGFLPNSKTNTRYDRLSRNLIQLKAFRSSTLQHSLGKPSPLPAPPFLVSAISDGLLASKYKDRVRTVPCEAETQCTSSVAIDAGDIILTNDSDLLLLAQINRVMFFNDIEVRSPSTYESVLRGECYDGARIRKELDCDDLVMLGYLLSEHSNSTLRDLARRVKKDQAVILQPEAAYKLFRQQYLPLYQYSPFAWATEGTTAFAKVLHHLDARVSEYVCGWGAAIGNITFPLLGHSSSALTPGDGTRHMFLPFLIDDPVRGSAWRPSGSIRCLAYSILALYGPQSTVMEVDRRGDRIIGVHTPLLASPASTSVACQSLLEAMPPDQHALSIPDGWKLFSISQVLSWIKDQSPRLPPKDQIRRMCLGAHAMTDWEAIHFSAQVQAHLYSLRILKQILDVYLAAEIEVEGMQAVVSQDLCDRLLSLPSISGMMPSVGCGLGLGESSLCALDEVLSVFYPSEAVRMEERLEIDERKKKRPRKDKDQRSQRVPRKPMKTSTMNQYSVLADM